MLDEIATLPKETNEDVQSWTKLGMGIETKHVAIQGNFNERCRTWDRAPGPRKQHGPHQPYRDNDAPTIAERDTLTRWSNCPGLKADIAYELLSWNRRCG